MADTVAEINADVRALLNDSSGVILTDAFLLPLIKKAYTELQTELRAHSLPVTKEVSASVTVNAGDVNVTTTDIIDMIEPLKCFERPAGSSEQYVKMDELDWEPELILVPELRYWNWRENEIKFPGATSNREVKVQYLKGFPTLIGNSSVIVPLDARPWLGNRVAMLAAFSLGASDRAAALSSDTERLWNTFIGSSVKGTQSVSTRRKPFRSNRMRRL